MTANENALTTFETRVRQLLLRFKDLKAENATLTDMLHKSEEAVKEVQQKLAQQQQDYEKPFCHWRSSTFRSSSISASELKRRVMLPLPEGERFREMLSPKMRPM